MKIMERYAEKYKNLEKIYKRRNIKIYIMDYGCFARDIILKVQMENFADVNFDEDWETSIN